MKKIFLTQNKVALVDDEDYAIVMNYATWCAHFNGTKWYAVCTKNYSNVKMHRFIMKAEKGQEVDHINGNSLDNRKENLRFVTRAHNLQNRIANKNSTSQYVGVYWENWTGKWCAAIKKDGVTTKIGRFTNEKEAAIARDKAALEIFGPHARLNFPEN